MGPRSPEPPTEEGSSGADRKAAKQVRRSLADHRLHRRADILRVRRTGKRIALPLLTVWIAPSDVSRRRAGVIVALHGRTAVARNKLKRRLRHILRSELLARLNEPQDIVVSARPAAYDATFTALREAVTHGLAR
jgi:ribonuclease P protein component